MRIRILGAGFYGCHIGLALARSGHEVEVHEVRDRIFAGASGAIPARLHQGFHYPRSRMTRAACQEHSEAFMTAYGHLTRSVPINIYAIAADHSLVDFDQYVRTLRGEVDFIPIHDAAEFGLLGCEGAVLTGERHIITDRARAYFEAELGERIRLGQGPEPQAGWDWTIDCTFCANSAAGVDRYEPCLVLLLAGPTERAITIMDGPFASLYPWDEDQGLCSLSSARFSPFSKDCRSWQEARDLLDDLSAHQIAEQGDDMIRQMRAFYPAIDGFEVAEERVSIRAMPLSGADTRLVDVARIGERSLRVRAGKIDAIIHAEQAVRRIVGA